MIFQILKRIANNGVNKNWLVLLIGLSLSSSTSWGEIQTNSIGMQMQQIPAGEFLQGFDNENGGENEFRIHHIYSNQQDLNFERPVHRVAITKEFEIGIHEVTVAQFITFVESTGYITNAEKQGTGMGFFPLEENFVDRYHTSSDINWKNPGFDQTDNHPVTVVSWKDAQAFCEWLSKKEGRHYRLPTESEWEYVCRASTTTWYSWGKDPKNASNFANVADGTLESKYSGSTSYQRAIQLTEKEGDGFAITAPVASFQPNPWGIYDTHGNAWEWCQDRWDEEIYEKRLEGLPHYRWKERLIEDPLNESKTAQHEYGDWRVIRGGGWNCASASTRSTIRSYAEAEDSTVYIGFRVVREIDESNDKH